jgi:chromosome segregation ATPase
MNKKNIVIYFSTTLVAFSLIGCADDDDNQTPGQQAQTNAQAAGAAVNRKAEEVKSAVVSKPEDTRSEAEKNISAAVSEIQNSVKTLDEKIGNAQTTLNDQSKRRLTELKNSLQNMNNRLNEFKKASEPEWKAKRDQLNQSIADLKQRVNNAAERQKFEAEVNAKLDKISTRVENIKNLQVDAKAAKAANATKEKLSEERQVLESKLNELRGEFAQFQVAADEHWTDFKQKFEKTFDELSAQFKGLELH